jgi:16S rRNA (adenine1518-N6/adenine1519-N6)-dimethyltransferase
MKTDENSLFARLKKFDIRPIRSLGQNFLIDKNVIAKIIESADICKSDLVIEIGPGAGSMTEALAESSGALVAIEIDRHMIPLLEEVLSGYDNTKIINSDILEIDIEKVISEFPDFKSYKVVANLPYYITTPIIMKFIESSNPPEQMTVMMQKEVADRLRAKPGNKEYGSLTVAIGVFCDISKVMDVSSNCFYPKPDVASTVLNLQNKGKDILKGIDRDLFFSLVRASFAQRRKKMSNSVVNTAGLSLTREQVEKVLENIGVSNDIRAEKLSLEQFISFSVEIESLLRN